MGKLASDGNQSLKKSGYGTLAENGKEDSIDFTELKEMYDDTVQKFIELLQRIDPEITLQLLKKSQIPKKLSKHEEESNEERYEKPKKRFKLKANSKRPPSSSEESHEEDVKSSKRAKEAKKTTLTKSELEDTSMTDESDENDDDDDNSETESFGSIEERAAAPRATQAAIAPALLNMAATTLLPMVADVAMSCVRTPQNSQNNQNIAPMIQDIISSVPYGQGYPVTYPPNAYHPPMQPLGVPPEYPQVAYYPYQLQRPISPGAGYSQGPYQGPHGQQQGYLQQLNQIPQGPHSPSQDPFQQSSPSVQYPQQDLKYPTYSYYTHPEPPRQTTNPYQPPSQNFPNNFRALDTTQPPGYEQKPQPPQAPPSEGNTSGQPQVQQLQPTQAAPPGYTGQTPPRVQFLPKPIGNDPNSIEVAQAPRPTKSASPTSKIPHQAQEHSFIGQVQPFPVQEPPSPNQGSPFQNQAHISPGQRRYPSPPPPSSTPSPSPAERAPTFTQKKRPPLNNQNMPPNVNELEREVLQSLKDIDDQINVILNKLEVKWD